MNRWIDTLTDLDITNLVEHLADVNVSVEEVKQELEKLFVPVPNWSDNLDPNDNQTWVLCFVSDESPKETWDARWITSKVFGEVGPVQDSTYEVWKYTTPVDLNLRYTKGEDTL